MKNATHRSRINNMYIANTLDTCTCTYVCVCAVDHSKYLPGTYVYTYLAVVNDQCKCPLRFMKNTTHRVHIRTCTCIYDHIMTQIW